MNARDDLNRASNARDDLDRTSEHLDRAADHAGDAAHHTKQAMQAAASGTLERTKDVARETGRKASHVAERAADVTKKAGHVAGHVVQAEPDVELEQRVDSTTGRVLEKTGDVLTGAAPVIGRGLEKTVDAAGFVVHAVGGPLGTIVGKIAGRVGGWWNSASEAIRELPEEEEQAYRVHFESYDTRPEDLTWDTARTAYTLGYIAAENPTYRDRPFEEIETDLQHGFAEDEPNEEYNTLRDFARFGYERAMVIRPSQDEDRVTIH